MSESLEASENESFDFLCRHSRATAKAMLLDWAASCRSDRVRDLIEFGEEEVILPKDGGPSEGEPFVVSRQPYVRLLYREISSGKWSEVWISGPSQSGKTLSAFVILLCYIVCELRRNVGVCVPYEDMIADKWAADIRPVFEASPSMRHLLPSTGPGSRNGVVKDTVRLTNGRIIKFFTAGGSDQSKAGFTAPFIVGTEAAGFSRSTSTSKEGDPIRQIRARQRSLSRFNEDGSVNTDRLLTFEGTVTVEQDLPWRMKSESSDSKIVCPCVYCGEWVSPEREHFTGWEDATNEMEAAASGVFHCPACGEVYTPDDRRAMNDQCKLIHTGQTIDKDGTIHGDDPPTTTLFFRWSAWNNLFIRESDIAVEEWKASKLEPETEAREDAEKELNQFIWCVPYTPKMAGSSKLDRSSVRQRISDVPAMLVPANTDHLVAGVDVGRWWCWVYVLAICSDGQLRTVTAGRRSTGLQVPTGQNVRQLENAAIKSCVDGILNELFRRGFGCQGGGSRLVDFAFVDRNYFPTAVDPVVKEFGRDRCLPAIGRGKSQMDKMKYVQPRKVTSIIRKIGQGYHLEFTPKVGWHVKFDADGSKLAVQSALRVEPGQPGALLLPNGDPRERDLISRHMSAEVFRRYIDPKRGIVEEWSGQGQNHLLDCCGMAWMAAIYRGWDPPSTRLTGGNHGPGQTDTGRGATESSGFGGDPSIIRPRGSAWLARRLQRE